MERKLAAIFAADVVGYGRLMERDEAGTFARLRAHRKELFEPEIDRHHGRIFKLMGDGLLAEFGSVVDAVECAVVLQREMAERNNGLPDDQRIDVRIGLHLGDVIIEGDDRHGDAVNIASRLQQLAEPGGVCVSETVVKHVKQKVALRFEPQGEERLKNIAEPVAVYRVEIGAMAAQARGPSWFVRLPRLRLVAGAVAILLLLAAGGVATWYLQAREPPPKGFPTIAVLPFDNFSGDPAQDYLSDGVSEEIITMLSRFPDLAVIARNSTFAYKGRPVDVRQVGRDLGVDYVVEGSVRKEADKLRIVAQLVDAHTGQHVWAERYENAGSDPWLLQDEVTGKIIGSLTGEQGLIRKKEYDGAWGKDAGSLQEHDYYLRGHDIFINAETKEDYNRAGEIWHEGLVKFPRSSLLRIKLGWFYYVRADSFWSDDAAADYRRAGEFGREVQSTPNLSPQVRRLAHWLMAFVLSQEGDFDRAIAETDAAIALAPYDAFMLGTLSNIPMRAGKPAQAIEWIEKAMVRDPQNEKPNNFRLGRAYYLQGDYEKALAAINKGSPPWVDVPLFLASIYVRLDRMEEARAEVKKALVMEPGFTQAKWREAWFYRDPNILERQLADLGKAGLPEK
jgi:TolB-like protein/class 3 adenylate cyclase